MHRFHLPVDHWESATLDSKESHHCLQVLRLEEGNRITVFDGCGRESMATIGSIVAGKVSLHLTASATTPSPPCAITIGQAVPKGKNMDLIVQKAVELGAAHIAPLLSDRTVIQLDSDDSSKKQEKWQSTVIEACKQCGQNRIPSVALPVPPRDFFQIPPQKNALLLIASLQPDARPIKTVLKDYRQSHNAFPKDVTVLVGPEGDFTPAEIALSKSHGYQPVTLGPIILRTETAAIYCLSVLEHELFTPTQE